MNADRDAHCHAAVDAFVGRKMKADELVRELARLWHRDAGGACVDGALVSIHQLCTAYASALPAGAGYGVSEEQLRSEIRSLASLR